MLQPLPQQLQPFQPPPQLLPPRSPPSPAAGLQQNPFTWLRVVAAEGHAGGEELHLIQRHDDVQRCFLARPAVAQLRAHFAHILHAPSQHTCPGAHNHTAHLNSSGRHGVAAHARPQRRRRRVVVRHGEEQEQGVVAVGQPDADTQLGVEGVVQEMGCE